MYIVPDNAVILVTSVVMDNAINMVVLDIAMDFVSDNAVTTAD